MTAVTHSIGEAASASLKGPSGRPAAAWVASASAAEREATTPVLPIGGGCTVAAQPAESGAHELVLYDDLGLRKRAMPISVKAPPPLARPWATLPRARKDEVRRWLRRCGRCRAFVDGSDMLQLPLPPEDDGAADAPLAWTRPAPGRVAVLRDFLPAKLAARAIRAAEAHLVEAAAHTVGVGEARPAYSSRAYRTNRSCFLDAHDEGVVRAIRAAVRAAFPEVEGRELELQVVHYKPGEVFRLHSDVGVRRNDGTFGRSWSMFVYLRGPAGAGGGTVFPRLASSDVYDGATGAVHLDCCESVDGGGVSLKPGDGSALVWRNVDAHDRRDRRAFHAGAAVAEGQEKWGLNVWLPLSPASQVATLSVAPLCPGRTDHVRVARVLREAAVADVATADEPPVAPRERGCGPPPRPPPAPLAAFRALAASLPGDLALAWGGRDVVQFCLRTVEDVVGGAADRWLEARGSLPGWRRDAVAAALRGAAADLGLAIRVDVAWRTL